MDAPIERPQTEPDNGRTQKVKKFALPKFVVRNTFTDSWILQSFTLACALSFMIGNWNAFLENVKIRRRIFYQLHLLIAGTYVLCCVLLTIVNSLYGFYVLKQFDGDSKIGPQGWGRFDTSKGWKVSDSNYKHEIEYEFGMAFYWNTGVFLK